MQSVTTLYQQAHTHHRAGQLAEAEALYQQVIMLQPKHADALHLLGVLSYQTNRAALAVQHIAQALAIDPRNLNYLNNHGLALSANNQPQSALKSFQQAILLQPKDLDVQLNIGNTLLTLNRFEEAAGYYHLMPARNYSGNSECEGQ